MAASLLLMLAAVKRARKRKIEEDIRAFCDIDRLPAILVESLFIKITMEGEYEKETQKYNEEQIRLAESYIPMVPRTL
jgi:hypothetical protein